MFYHLDLSILDILTRIAMTAIVAYLIYRTVPEGVRVIRELWEGENE